MLFFIVPPEISARTRYLHERLREDPPPADPRAEASQDQAAYKTSEPDLSRRGPAGEAEPVAPSSRDRGTMADFLFWKQQFSTGGYDRFPERLQSLEITEPQAAWLTQPCLLPGEE